MECNYRCIRCNKDFNKKQNLNRHLLKKSLCNYYDFDLDRDYLIKLLNNNEYLSYVDSLKNKKQCQYCKKIVFKYNLKRHYKSCKKYINNELIISENNDLKEEKCNQVINNINNITNNNINIQIINPIGEESYDVKNIYKLLSFDPNPQHFHTENDIHNFSSRMLNYIDNYNIIFDKIYENPQNHNFQIINKRNKICKVKDNNKNKHINFEKLSNIIFSIIDNIYELSIHEYEVNNDDKSLNHYMEFKKNLKDRYEKFILKYKNSETSEDKQMYYDVLYKFYKGFKDLLKNNEQRIFTKSYDMQSL